MVNLKQLRAICSFFAILFPLFLNSQANNMACGTQGTEKKTIFIPVPQSINNSNRDGVTRIAFNLQGLPHTSNRIDDVILFIKGKSCHASDIDGVDFKRYFQWEEDGIIPIEVDFPKQKKFESSDSVQFITVHGIYSSALGRAARKVK